MKNFFPKLFFLLGSNFVANIKFCCNYQIRVLGKTFFSTTPTCPYGLESTICQTHPMLLKLCLHLVSSCLSPPNSLKTSFDKTHKTSHFDPKSHFFSKMLPNDIKNMVFLNLSDSVETSSTACRHLPLTTLLTKTKF